MGQQSTSNCHPDLQQKKLYEVLLTKLLCGSGVAHHVDCSAEISLELQQLRHCLAVVARYAAVELGAALPTLFTPGLRRLLWAALSAWSQGASPEAKPGTYRADVCTPSPVHHRPTLMQ